MASFNKVILAGNLTRDPQLTYLPSNTPVAEFGMAMNRRWRGQDGQTKEEVCFVDCRCYGRQAETLNQYMKKGRPLLVEGHLKFDQWEGKDGQKRSRLWVIVDTFQFLGGRDDAPSAGGESAPRGQWSGRQQQSAPAAAAPGPSGGRWSGPPAGGAAGAPEMDEGPPPADDFGAPGGENIPF